MDVARPRCEAAEITGSLLRPPAANPKEANAMSSSGEQTLAPDKQRTDGEEEGGDPPDGGGIYIGGTGKREGKEGGKGIENKKLPITADRNPYTYPLYPILVVILLDFLFFFLDEGGRPRFYYDSNGFGNQLL